MLLEPTQHVNSSRGVVICILLMNRGALRPVAPHFGLIDCIRNISRSVGEHPRSVAKTAIADHINLADIGYRCGSSPLVNTYIVLLASDHTILRYHRYNYRPTLKDFHPFNFE